MIFVVLSSTPAQDPNIQVHPQHFLSSAAAAIGLHNQLILSQTIRNDVSGAYLHAQRPYRGFSLTAVHCRHRLVHIRWCLALWRVLHFMDASQFQYRPEGRQCHVCEQFADDGLLNAQRYRGETLRPIVATFVHD